MLSKQYIDFIVEFWNLIKGNPVKRHKLEIDPRKQKL